MTRETKIGIAMVLVMVGVFGFLVYKRVTRPGEVVAKADDVDSDDGDTPGDDDADAPDADDGKPEILRASAQSLRPIPQDEPESDSDPFSGAEQPRSAAPVARTRLPTSIPDDTADESDAAGEFAASSSSSSSAVGFGDDSAETPAGNEPETDGNDPFSAVADGNETDSGPAMDTSSTPAFDFGATASTETEDSDPFPADDSQQTVTTAPAMTPPAATRSFDIAEDDETVSVQARARIPEPEFGEPEFDEEMPVAEPEPQPEPFRTLPTESAAPQLAFDDSDSDADRFGDYEPVELAEGPASFGASNVRGEAPFRDPVKTADARPTAITIHGSSHVVQPNENFWTISQKKYGTGRYFQALAVHNQARVPDATKMKPGMEVLLPPAEELDRKYRSVISPAAPAEPSAAAGAPNGAPGEFQIGSGGQPTYRIGSGDTLSGISQKYLGRASRWEQIQEMNRDVLKDGKPLKVGAVLRLPSDASQLQLSNQPRIIR